MLQQLLKNKILQKSTPHEKAMVTPTGIILILNGSADAVLMPKILKNKAHGIYRYLYHDYLYPQHLPKTDRHDHISNFG